MSRCESETRTRTLSPSFHLQHSSKLHWTAGSTFDRALRIGAPLAAAFFEVRDCKGVLHSFSGLYKRELQ
jgi:hypothetical protein